MKKTLFSFLFVCLYLAASGQFLDTAIIHHTIDSKAFGEERKISVFLPSRYLENPDESFMVTYVLDAQGPQYFNMLLGNLDYLTSRYRIIPTIVVGIHSKNRYAEFTPPARPNPRNENDANFDSKLHNLYEHLVNEVFPLVEEQYRTESFRSIIGHSRGGSFVVQSLFDGHEDLFDAYISISPGLQFDDYLTIEYAEKRLRLRKNLNKFFFVSSGDIGETEIYFDHHVRKLDTVINQNIHATLNYHRAFYEGKDHFTTVLPALNDGLVLLKNEHMVSFENISKFANKDGAKISEQIDHFIHERKSVNSFIHMPPMTYYARSAGEFYEMEDYKNALDMYTWIEKRGALEKWWEVLNFGVCYKQAGQKEKAREKFDQSLVMLEDWKEQYGDNFEKVKADVLRQIGEHMED